MVVGVGLGLLRTAGEVEEAVQVFYPRLEACVKFSAIDVGHETALGYGHFRLSHPAVCRLVVAHLVGFVV